MAGFARNGGDFRQICTMTGVSDRISPEQDPYLLSSRHEIVRLFRRMLDNGLLIQMQGRLHTISVVTTLLDIDQKADLLIVDAAPQATMNQALLDAGRASFDVMVDQVKVQFIGEPLKGIVFEGRPALAMPIPPSIRRIQRRGSFRVQVPISNPATCTLVLRPTPITVALHDISSTGVALANPQSELDLQIGMFLRDCTLLLPETGRLRVNLQVVREQELELANGKRVRHVGAAFVDLRGPEETSVQNYIFGLERMMIARKRGLV